MKLNFKTQKPLSQEEVSQQDIQFAVEQTKLQLQADVLATQKSLSEAKSKLEDLKTTYPLKTQEIVDTMYSINSLEEGLKTIQSLQKEFGML